MWLKGWTWRCFPLIQGASSVRADLLVTESHTGILKKTLNITVTPNYPEFSLPPSLFCLWGRLCFLAASSAPPLTQRMLGKHLGFPDDTPGSEEAGCFLWPSQLASSASCFELFTGLLASWCWRRQEVACWKDQWSRTKEPWTDDAKGPSPHWL